MFWFFYWSKHQGILFLHLSGFFSLLRLFYVLAMRGETAQHMIHINGEPMTPHQECVASISALEFSLTVSLRPESESSSESRSRSRSPGPEKITFITSFGGSDDEAAAAAAAAAVAAAAASQTSAPHSGHTSSTLQHSAGHSRGSRSVTFHLYGFFISCFSLSQFDVNGRQEDY